MIPWRYKNVFSLMMEKCVTITKGCLGAWSDGLLGLMNKTDVTGMVQAKVWLGLRFTMGESSSPSRYMANERYEFIQASPIGDADSHRTATCHNNCRSPVQWHSQREEGVGTSHLASILPVGWFVGAIHVHTGWTFMDQCQVTPPLPARPNRSILHRQSNIPFPLRLYVRLTRWFPPLIDSICRETPWQHRKAL